MFQVWVNFHTRCEYTSALDVADELIEQGRNSPDPSLGAYGHGMAAQTLYHMGRFKEALARMARCADLADFERDREIVRNTNHEIRASSEARVGTAHWILGYPDRARRSAESTIGYARSARHPFNLAFVLAVSSHTYFYLGDLGSAAGHIDEALAIAANQRLASLQRMTLPLYEGRKLLWVGRFGDGLRVTLPALEAIRASRQRNTVSQNSVMLGRLLVGSGEPAAGLCADRVRDCPRGRDGRRLRTGGILAAARGGAGVAGTRCGGGRLLRPRDRDRPTPGSAELGAARCDEPCRASAPPR